MLNNSRILHNSRILNNSRIHNNSRMLSAGEIGMTSLVSTSRYWVSHPSPKYTLQWSQLGCAVTRPAPAALCLAQATLSPRPTPMALRRRHTFLVMQYECDTSKAERGTGADLSIHRLEPTVTQRPYTAVRTIPCSRNPFLTLRRPARLPVPV